MDESAEFPDLRVTFLSVFSRPWAAVEWWHGGGNIYCTVTMTSNTEHRSGFPPLLLIFSLFGKAFRLGRFFFQLCLDRASTPWKLLYGRVLSFSCSCSQSRFIFSFYSCQPIFYRVMFSAIFFLYFIVYKIF